MEPQENPPEGEDPHVQNALWWARTIYDGGCTAVLAVDVLATMVGFSVWGRLAAIALALFFLCGVVDAVQRRDLVGVYAMTLVALAFLALLGDDASKRADERAAAMSRGARWLRIIAASAVWLVLMQVGKAFPAIWAAILRSWTGHMADSCYEDPPPQRRAQ